MSDSVRLESRHSGAALGDDLKAAVRSYWDARAADFDDGDSRVTRTDAIRAQWSAVFRDVLGGARREVLDVGCGTGEVMVLLASDGHVVSGADISPEMVRLSLRKAEERGIRLDVRVADGERLPFADASFDVVHARHLLWTLPDPHAAVREWLRVLRPSGRIVVTESHWSGSYDSRAMRFRIWLGRTVTRLSGRAEPTRTTAPRYPSGERFPFYGGLSGESVRAFLASSGLRDAATRDVAWLRAQGRASLSWYRRLGMKPHRDYYVTWATKG